VTPYSLLCLILIEYFPFRTIHEFYSQHCIIALSIW